MAVHHDFDVVGIAILAVVTSPGGGILRDIVLGDTPPLASTRWEDLVVSSAGGRFFRRPPVARASRAASARLRRGRLGLFCVTTAGPGVTTAAGGGVLREPIAREAPELFRLESELPASPAGAGPSLSGATRRPTPPARCSEPWSPPRSSASASSPLTASGAAHRLRDGGSGRAGQRPETSSFCVRGGT